jgi:hypothetical protein
MKRTLIAAPIALALFAGGYLAGQQSTPAPVTAAPHAGLWDEDFCQVRVRTESFSGGTYTSVSGVVARWDRYGERWSSVFDWNALAAVGSASCDRRY